MAWMFLLRIQRTSHGEYRRRIGEIRLLFHPLSQLRISRSRLIKMTITSWCRASSHTNASTSSFQHLLRCLSIGCWSWERVPNVHVSMRPREELQILNLKHRFRRRSLLNYCSVHVHSFVLPRRISVSRWSKHKPVVQLLLLIVAVAQMKLSLISMLRRRPEFYSNRRLRNRSCTLYGASRLCAKE